MAESNSPRTVKLAAKLLEAVTKLEEHLAQNGLPSCSFEPGAPARLPLPPQMTESLDEAVSSLQELHALLLGPMGWMMQQMGEAYDMVGMQAMYRYKIPLQFPVGDKIAVTELAHRCGVDEEMFARLVQHAVTKQFLAQPQPGYVAHTAFSSMFASAPPLMEWVGFASEELWPAGAHIIQALTKWPGPPWLPSQTGHNLAEGTSVYDWGALDADAVVVDVGGGDGIFAMALAERHPKLKHIIVQDVAATVEKAASLRPQHEGDVISFQTHDFFHAQPVKHADVYFLRKILHDWPDEYAVKILQQLVPAMKPGARVLINDHVMLPPGTMSGYNEWSASQERTESQWKDLIASADPRFNLKFVTPMPPGPLALMEIIWE
ncbi:uncharacterized protein LA080_007824 [Diaporthe eres]|nr:uncharacterized protein LA080_007824 [Diaporthe eres]